MPEVLRVRMKALQWTWHCWRSLSVTAGILSSDKSNWVPSEESALANGAFIIRI